MFKIVYSNSYFNCKSKTKGIEMISKKLLSEVLGYEVKDIVLSTQKNLCFFNCNVEERINIYELASKCKEWAFWNDYEIITRMRIPNIYIDKHKIDYGYEINHINNGLVKASWWINTEAESILKACEWVLKETK